MPLALIKEYYDIRRLLVLLLDSYFRENEFLYEHLKNKVNEIDKRVSKRRLLLRKHKTLRGFQSQRFDPKTLNFD